MKPALPGRFFPPATRALCLCSLLLVPVLVRSEQALAQDPGSDVTFTKQRVFRIPFQVNPGQQQIKQVWLYVSTDEGRTWHPTSSVKPEDAAFTYSAPQDGAFWFTVRTVDLQDRAFPLNMDTAKPGLKVVVDQLPPAITVRTLPPRDGQVGVEWDVQEENPDLSTFALEMRQPGAQDWTPLRPEPALNGSYFWKPIGKGANEVRVRLRDRAGNEGVGLATLQPAQEAKAAAGNLSPAAPAGPAARMVNSKRFHLNYEIQEVGKSGISAVELWSTPDGRRWEKFSEQKRTDALEVRPPYEVNVEKEGLYGFTLVMRSGVGLSVQPPQSGDTPQVWVEVDLTRPVVRITKIDVGRGPQAGSLTIDWTATDKNLGRDPITLSYSDKPDGQFTPIVANRENTGRYVWRMPPDVPSQVLVRVEAVDRAGNVGSAETSKPIVVDLVLPTPKNVDIAPK